MTMLQIQAMPKPCFFKEFRNNKKKNNSKLQAWECKRWQIMKKQELNLQLIN